MHQSQLFVHAIMYSYVRVTNVLARVTQVSSPMGQAKHFMSGSAFVSTTSRWTGDVKQLDQPGPGSEFRFSESIPLFCCELWCYAYVRTVVRILIRQQSFVVFRFSALPSGGAGQTIAYLCFSALPSGGTGQTIVYFQLITEVDLAEMSTRSWTDDNSIDICACCNTNVILLLWRCTLRAQDEFYDRKSVMIFSFVHLWQALFLL